MRHNSRRGITASGQRYFLIAGGPQITYLFYYLQPLHTWTIVHTCTGSGHINCIVATIFVIVIKKVIIKRMNVLRIFYRNEKKFDFFQYDIEAKGKNFFSLI